MSSVALRACVVAAVLASGLLLSACGAGARPTAQDLDACGTVNNMAAGVFVTDPLSQQQVLAAQLAGQARAAGNAKLIAGAEKLQVASDAQSPVRVNAALASLTSACTAMGVGPSSGGL